MEMMLFSEALSTHSLNLFQGTSSSSTLDPIFGLILITVLTNTNKRVIPKGDVLAHPFLLKLISFQMVTL